MQDPSAYDPYLDLSPYGDVRTAVSYNNGSSGQADSRENSGRKENTSVQYSEVEHQGQAFSDASLHGQGHHDSNSPILKPGGAIADYRVINWPDGPRFVKQSAVIAAFTYMLDAILVLIALLFLAVAIMALRLNGEPANSGIAIAMGEAMKLVRWSTRLSNGCLSGN